MKWAMVWVMVLAGPACGWGWRVHRLVAYRAAQALQERLPRHAGAWKWIRAGATAPDEKGAGNIPAKDHVYHITGKAFGGAPRRVQEMFWRLLSEEMPEDRLLFEMGRLSHLVADLCQPLHTDGRNRCAEEPVIHPKFERAADEDAELQAGVPVPAAPEERAAWRPVDAAALDWDARMVEVARESWRDYDRVCAAYAAGRGGYAETRGVVRRRVERAVALVVEIWDLVLEKRGHGERVRREAGVWACLAVPVVLMWFVVRGRVPGEEGVYPGERLPAPADRRRADAAWDRLVERIEGSGGRRPP